jgi:hypothetical protein
MTTLWTILGYPPTGVAVPLWVKAGEQQPGIFLGNGATHRAPVCDFALALKRRIFSLERGNGPKYMYFRKIYNSEGTGYMQRLAPIEVQIFQSYREAITQWRKKGIDLQELYRLNKSMEMRLIEAYSLLDP